MINKFNPDNKKVIFSIDGGGMKGLIAASILAEMEISLGENIYDIGDFFVGTSTGAVIVGLLASGKSPQWIIDNVYRDRFPKAFGRTGWIKYLRYAGRRLKSMYELDRFTSAFSKEFGSLRIKDIDKPLLVTTKDTRNGANYFITNTGKGSEMFSDWQLVDAVAASSAAPIYFSSFEGIYSDGGVGAHNNPSMIGLIEAFNYFPKDMGFTPENTMVISVGTGHINSGSFEGSGGWGVAAWVEFLFREMFEDTSSFYSSALRSVFGEELDYRRYNVDLSDKAVMQLEIRAKLSNHMHEHYNLMKPPSLNNLLPDSSRPEEIDLMEMVGRAYARVIDYTLPNASPWDFEGGQQKPMVLPRP